MGVHLIRSMGAAQRRMQNVNQDGQRREGKKGKGEMKKFILFAYLEHVRSTE